MVINLENFFQRLLFARKLKVYEGYFEIYNVPCVIFPAESFSEFVDKLIKVTGKKGKVIIYKEGLRFGKLACDMIKKISGNVTGDKLLEAIFQIAGLGGWGLWKFYRKDDIKEEAIVHGLHIATAEFDYRKKRRFEPSCNFVRGIVASGLRLAWKDNLIEVVETRCISQGNKYCEFIAKKRDKFNKKNKYVKKQLDLKC